MVDMRSEPMHSHSRRPLLLAGVTVITLLCARRAHAVSDPNTVEVGGSVGADTERIACGPDVRVRHATAGVRYERVFEDPAEKPGTGYLVDARGGVGTATITDVSDADKSAPSCATIAASAAPCSASTQLFQTENNVSHVEGAAQLTAGYDWRTFAISGGVGVFGLASLTDGNLAYQQKYYPLPAIDLRVGRRVGFSGNFGLGALPVAGLARFYGLYGIAQHRFQEGGEVGIGAVAIAGTLDGRNGIFGKGSIPIANGIALGAFGLLDATQQVSFGGVNWTLGGALTLSLDRLDQ